MIERQEIPSLGESDLEAGQKEIYRLERTCLKGWAAIGSEAC